jgi:lipid-A-disaccharide synthase
MLIAGEASGDLLAAELVVALRQLCPDAQFIGAGGTKMKVAGVHLAFDLTQHSVIGVSDVLKNLLEYRRLFNQLLALAIEKKPDAIIGVDYGGFNLRFGHAIKQYVRDNPFSKWNPKIIQFVSPQVWASRPGRANLLAADYDLLLSIFPFEKAWYAQRVPNLRVEFVGHPMVERYATIQSELPLSSTLHPPSSQRLLLLPGSRKAELKRHLPVMLDAVELIQRKLPDCRTQMVLSDPALKALAEKLCEPPPAVEIQVGNLPQALAQADVVISKTGTVTVECAFFGVPAVALYKTSWLTYQIAKRIVCVKSLTMPNLLAGEEVYPEFVQNAATPENIAAAALELLQNESRRTQIRLWLAAVVARLGEPGATKRAAEAILSLYT